MKFQKRNARLKWWARFDKMTSIRSIVQVPNDMHFYGCGDYNVNNEMEDLSLAVYTAAIFRIQNDGTIKFYLSIGGTNPMAATQDAPNQDRCMGVSLDPSNGYVTALLQTKMKEIRYFSPGNFYDTTLLMFDNSGTVEKAVSISNADLGYSMLSAN